MTICIVPIADGTHSSLFPYPYSPASNGCGMFSVQFEDVPAFRPDVVLYNVKSIVTGGNNNYQLETLSVFISEPRIPWNVISVTFDPM